MQCDATLLDRGAVVMLALDVRPDSWGPCSRTAWLLCEVPVPISPPPPWKSNLFLAKFFPQWPFGAPVNFWEFSHAGISKQLTVENLNNLPSGLALTLYTMQTTCRKLFVG
jgi:hypothetical protein